MFPSSFQCYLSVAFFSCLVLLGIFLSYFLREQHFAFLDRFYFHFLLINFFPDLLLFYVL